MRPIQLWLPTLISNPRLPVVERDRERAYQLRAHEDVIWLLPDGPGHLGWRDDNKARCVAINSEGLDQIHVFHIGENGYAVGQGFKHWFPDGHVNNLLDAWLNMSGSIEILHQGDTVSIQTPKFIEGKVSYVTSTVPVAPLHTCPVEIIDEHEGTFGLGPAPERKRLLPVSIDSEGSDYFGEMIPEEFMGLPTWVSKKRGTRSMMFLLRWPSSPLKKSPQSCHHFGWSIEHRGRSMVQTTWQVWRGEEKCR